MKSLFGYLALAVMLCSIALIANTFRFGNFRTTLEPAGFLKDGGSDLVASRWPVPLMYDWDGDGKNDLLVGHNEEAPDGSAHGRISLFKNLSEDSTPRFDGSILLSSCSDECAAVDIDAFG